MYEPPQAKPRGPHRVRAPTATQCAALILLVGRELPSRSGTIGPALLHEVLEAFHRGPDLALGRRWLVPGDVPGTGSERTSDIDVVLVTARDVQHLRSGDASSLEETDPRCGSRVAGTHILGGHRQVDRNVMVGGGAFPEVAIMWGRQASRAPR